MKKQFSTLILAAGNSSRMNFPKAFLPFHETSTFIGRILDTYIEAGAQDIVLLVNNDLANDMQQFLKNEYPASPIQLVVNGSLDKGRFYSVQLGLSRILSGPCFLQNVDNPFISKQLLQAMLEKLGEHDVVQPVFEEKGGHPVLLGNDMVKHLANLPGHEHHLKMELEKFDRFRLNWPSDLILANINTPELFQQYFGGSNYFIWKGGTQYSTKSGKSEKLK